MPTTPRGYPYPDPVDPAELYTPRQDLEDLADAIDGDVATVAATAAGAVAKSLVDAKGDLLVGTAGDTVARKAVGADGRALVADSAQSDGLAWADLSATYLALAGGTMTGALKVQAAHGLELVSIGTDTFTAAASGDGYPNGYSYFFATAAGGWPAIGMVYNHKVSDIRFLQEYVAFGGQQRLYRTWHATNGWSQWAGYVPIAAAIDTSQTTTSTSYTDLATSGPAATVTVGPSGVLVVDVSALVSNSAADDAFMGFALSGANTLAASDATALRAFQAPVGATRRTVVTGLTPGSTTATAKYRVDSGTGSFVHRRIAVEAK